MSVNTMTQEEVQAVRRAHCEPRQCCGLWRQDVQEWCCWRSCIAFERAAERLREGKKS